MSKWATSQDCERLRQQYPWINSRERGYISAEKSDPEFMAESFEDNYMTWQEAEVDRWYNCFGDSDYEACGITLEIMEDVWKAAEANRVSREPK